MCEPCVPQWKQGDQSLLAEMSHDEHLSHEQRIMCRRLAAMTASPPVVGTTPGVNCPNCGHRLPMGYSGPCVACDAPNVLDLPGAPVVEREAIARIIEPLAWSGRDQWNGECAFNDNLNRVNSLAKADAILALTPLEKGITTDDTPVEGVGSSEQQLISDAKAAWLADEPSTPVAQGDEVRDALKLAYVTGFNDGWQDGNGEGDAVNTVCRGDGLGDFMSGITGLALATLTKGARDAG